MQQLLADYLDEGMLVAFLALAVLLHMVFKKRGVRPAPRRVREWLWRLLLPLRAPLIYNVFLLLVMTVWHYVQVEEHVETLLPLTSLGLAWMVAAFIKSATSSNFSAWGIGICFGGFSLLKNLPMGRALYDMLTNTSYAPFGSVALTPYSVIKTVVLLAVFYLLAGSVVKAAENYLRKRRDIKPSNRNLLIQFFKILLYCAVGMLSLNILGVDLTTLTVFSGALGVGLGFGLQKITSNFVSGIILLFEQSVEEEDLIELNDGTMGFVRKTNARYTLIETFDSKEILVPNEDFITSRVTNWTYSTSVGRIELNVGVSYKSDVELARKLMLVAAKSHPLCIDEPEPICYLNEFGDSSVNFILHFWISDIKIGRLKPKDVVMTAIWHAFKENDIEIPFPQRDLHVKSIPENAGLATKSKSK